MSRPIIKMKIPSFNGANSPTVATPSAATPKIRFGPSKPNTPNEPLPTPKTKAGRTTKPSAKAAANKSGKRKTAESDEEEGGTVTVVKREPVEMERATKKIKLNVGGGPKTPTPVAIKMKHKGRPPKRPLGEGYDSEASDREEDPAIEEEFVLRMMPGEDCEYLRQAITDKRIGLPRREGGADVQMKFFHAEGRRAVVTIRGTHYAATLVDLPCIIETMKSWDKKGWYKAADICQMLWVFQKIPRELDAATVELPKIIDEATHQYPHGLTAPMYNARKRRFRKRLSKTTIENIEDAVEQLLEKDAQSQETTYVIVEPDGSRQGSQDYSIGSPGPFEREELYSENEDGDEDAEGEEDDNDGYFGPFNGNGQPAPGISELEDDMAADLEADLEAAFEAELDAGTPFSQAVAETPDLLLTNGATPEVSQNQDDSGDDSSEGDDEDAEGEDEVDEDERARLAQIQGVREDVADMEKQLANLQGQLGMQANPILKKRIKDNIEKVKSELQLKKSALGEGDGDD